MKEIVSVMLVSYSYGLAVATSNFMDKDLCLFNPDATSVVPKNFGLIFDISGYSSRPVIMPSSSFSGSNIDVKGFQKDDNGCFNFSSKSTFVNFLNTVSSGNLDSNRINAFWSLASESVETKTDFKVLAYFGGLRDALATESEFKTFSTAVENKTGPYVIEEAKLNSVIDKAIAAEGDNKYDTIVGLEALSNALGFKRASTTTVLKV